MKTAVSRAATAVLWTSVELENESIRDPVQLKFEVTGLASDVDVDETKKESQTPSS
jgi:hypothetical protein